EDDLLARHLAADHVEAFALRAVHEGAAIARAAVALDIVRHALGEEADAAAAVERHADLDVGREAGEIAHELGAGIFAGNDLARTRPLAADRIKEAAIGLRSLGAGRKARKAEGEECRENRL